uniref:Uncharacterized protein n=1 Tax=Arundo donax TaxID=35708 RepID=A0A0A8Z7B2_ARUDO
MVPVVGDSQVVLQTIMLPFL